MNYKTSYKVKSYINPEIKVGDIVRLLDGSSLSSVNKTDKNIYIANAYPKLTGSPIILEELDARVIQIDVTDQIVFGVNNAYLQDIVIQIGDCNFRTASNMVNLKEKFEEKEYPELKVGSWYSRDKNLFMCYNGKRDDEGYPCGHGFIWNSLKGLKYKPASGNGWWIEEEANMYNVEVALILEALKRGYQGKYHMFNEELRPPIKQLSFINLQNMKLSYLFCKESSNMIWRSDKGWAEIVETVTKEEAEKLIGTKIVCE